MRYGALSNATWLRIPLYYCLISVPDICLIVGIIAVALYMD